MFDESFINQLNSWNGKTLLKKIKFNRGIENSAGSLGHGLPYAVGIAMANKIKKIDSRVFVWETFGNWQIQIAC